MKQQLCTELNTAYKQELCTWDGMQLDCLIPAIKCARSLRRGILWQAHPRALALTDLWPPAADSLPVQSASVYCVFCLPTRSIWKRSGCRRHNLSTWSCATEIKRYKEMLSLTGSAIDGAPAPNRTDWCRHDVSPIYLINPTSCGSEVLDGGWWTGGNRRSDLVQCVSSQGLNPTLQV